MGRNGPTVPTGCGAGSLTAEALAAIRSLLDIKSVLPGSKISPGCARLGIEWQAKRDRDPIYCSLTAVFDLVVGDGKMHRRAGSLQLRPITMNLRRTDHVHRRSSKS